MIDLISINKYIFPYTSPNLINDKRFIMEILKKSEVSLGVLFESQSKLLLDSDIIKVYFKDQFSLSLEN